VVCLYTCSLGVVSHKTVSNSNSCGSTYSVRSSRLRYSSTVSAVPVAHHVTHSQKSAAEYTDYVKALERVTSREVTGTA
jgi:hypothetical protein